MAQYNSTTQAAIERLAAFVRKATGQLIFKKRLPKKIGRASIYVTSRSDVRLLAPGFSWSAGDLVAVADRYVKRGSVTWDIGSNLGIFSFCSALRAGPGGQVYSLEADPRYADIQFRTLLKFPEDAARIHVLCAAVADQVGLVELWVPKKGHSRSHLAQVKGNSAGEVEIRKPVITVTLDWLLDRWSPPAFIKIDVEGAEGLAINGADRLFSEIRPEGYIECAEENVGVLTKFFKDRDYRLFVMRDDGGECPVDRFSFNTIVRPHEKC